MRKRLLTSCVGLFCSLCWNLFMGEEGEEVSREKEQYMGVYGNEWLYCGCFANWRRLRHQNSCSMPFFKWKKKKNNYLFSLSFSSWDLNIHWLKKKIKGSNLSSLILIKFRAFVCTHEETWQFWFSGCSHDDLSTNRLIEKIETSVFNFISILFQNSDGSMMRVSCLCLVLSQLFFTINHPNYSNPSFF